MSGFITGSIRPETVLFGQKSFSRLKKRPSCATKPIHFLRIEGREKSRRLLSFRGLKGTALTEFLNADTNGMVTLIICRVTDETARSGLVHAFATKENGSNTPPLLRVKPREQ